VCLTVSLGNHFFDLWNKPTIWQFIGLCVLVALVTVLFEIAILRFAWGRLAQFSWRTKFIWVLLSLIVGGLAIIVVPITTKITTVHRLEIIATGKKNPSAKSTEVWIWGVFRGDGSPIFPSEIIVKEGWEARENILVSYQKQPAVVMWEVNLKDIPTISFGSHPYSGVALIRCDGQEQEIDLYNAEITVEKRIVLSTCGANQSDLVSIIKLIGLIAADIICLGILVFGVTVWLITRPLPTYVASAWLGRWSWLPYTMVCASIWLVWLLAFWPGVMSADSTTQWQQISTGRLDDFSPAFHAIINWLLTRLWFSPAAVALAQIISLSVVAGWGFSLLSLLGTPRWLVWVGCFIFALSPVNSIWVITLWKDIPYGIALLALTEMILLIVLSNGDWLQRWSKWIFVGIVTALIALFRHNGPVASFGTLFLLPLIYRKQLRWWIYAFLLALVIWITVKGPVYQFLQVQQNSSSAILPYLTVHQIAAHFSADTPMTVEEQTFLYTILPTENDWHYNCYSVVPTIWPEGAHFNWKVTWDKPDILLQTYWSLLLRNPNVNIHHLGCVTSMLWEVVKPEKSPLLTVPVSFGLYDNPTYIVPNPLVEESSKIPTLAYAFSKLILESQQGFWTIIWRPAVYLYLLLGGATVAAMRLRNWQVLLITLPVILHSAFLALLLVSPESRYQYPVFLVALVFWPGLVFSNKNILPSPLDLGETATPIKSVDRKEIKVDYFNFKFSSPLRLDLGCGAFKREGYIGIDNYASETQWQAHASQIDINWDLSQGIPFQDSSVAAIYTSHFLEHVNMDFMLREIHRVAEPGAEIHIVVPYANSAEGMYPGHVNFLTEKYFNNNTVFQQCFTDVEYRFDPTQEWESGLVQKHIKIPFDVARIFMFNVCRQMHILCKPKK
jgi:hypothetical protein